GAAEDADAAAIGRRRQAVEIGAEATVADAEVRGQRTERITLALPQTPDFRRDAVVGLRRVQIAPTGEVLATDRERQVSGQHAMELESQSAVLTKPLPDSREREDTHLDANVVARIPETESGHRRAVARLSASRATGEASADEA